MEEEEKKINIECNEQVTKETTCTEYNAELVTNPPRDVIQDKIVDIQDTENQESFVHTIEEEVTTIPPEQMVDNINYVVEPVIEDDNVNDADLSDLSSSPPREMISRQNTYTVSEKSSSSSKVTSVITRQQTYLVEQSETT